MLVFVINKHGEVLMPCSNRKARVLLKEKKAKVVNYKPFTIQLLYGSSGYTQKTNLGIDAGSKHIGIAITSGNNVLSKGQIDLRQDIKQLLETRKGMGRGRMGGPVAAGPGGICKCPKCGYEEPQIRGQPCMNKKCPKCETRMVRG